MTRWYGHAFVPDIAFRDGTPRLRLLDSQWHPLGELEAPLRTRIRPLPLTPQALPITIRDGDWSATLQEVRAWLASGGERSSTAGMPAAQVTLQVARKGAPAADWEPGSLVVADASGNVFSDANLRLLREVPAEGEQLRLPAGESTLSVGYEGADGPAPWSRWQAQCPGSPERAHRATR